MDRPAIIGAGLTRFGKYLDTPLHALAGTAIEQALADAGIERDAIDMAFVANAMAGVITGQVSIVGQAVLRPNGFAGIPVYNVDNACASSASALSLALHALAAGAADTVLVVGVERLYAADRTATYRALNGAADTEFLQASGIDAERESVFVAAVYPPRLAAYRDRYPDLKAETLAAIAVKNRSHAALNPAAQYTAPLTIEEVLAARMVVDPITALMCAPIGDGASAVVLTRAALATGGGRRPVWVAGCAVGMGGVSGESAVARTARRAYTQAGIGPGDVHVAEVHDSIAFNELAAYEELGLCEPGQGARLVEDGITALGGRLPVNPSGGLESRGHPVAATGLAQIVELVIQLRGEAGARQVADARVGIAENAGGFALDDTAAVAVTVLRGDRR